MTAVQFILAMFVITFLWCVFIATIFPILNVLNESQTVARYLHRLGVFWCLVRGFGHHDWKETYDPGEHYRWCRRCLEHEDLYWKDRQREG